MGAELERAVRVLPARRVNVVLGLEVLQAVLRGVIDGLEEYAQARGIVVDGDVVDED